MAEKIYVMNQMSETDKAYLAGIVDGEGSVLVYRIKRSANRSGYRFFPAVQIVNTSREMLEWVQSTSGLGKVYNKNDPGFGAKRKAFYWKLKHNQCKEFLEAILPYMIIKKDSALNCIEFCKITGLGKNYSNYPLEEYEKFWRRSSELNKRGELIDENIPVTSSQGREMAVMREAKKVRPPNKKYETHEELLAARRLKYRQHRDARVAGTPMPFTPLQKVLQGS